MTQREPLTYAKIELGLRENMDRMEILTEQFAASGDALAEAETAYKVGMSQARLSYRYENSAVKVTDQRADDEANVATEDLRKAYEVAKATHEAAKQALYTCRERRASLASLMASYRTMVEQGA